MTSLLDRVSLGHLKKVYAKLALQYSSHPEISRRLDRAMDILTMDTQYEISITEHKEDTLTFSVRSPNDNYTVTYSYSTQLGECTCLDREKLCKHRIAIKLLLESARSMKQAKLSIKEEM